MTTAKEAADIAVSEEEIQRVASEFLPEPSARAAGVSLTPAMSVGELIERQKSVLELMNVAMREGVHFGKIPGVKKPTLLKPGAEMLGVLFQLGAFFPEERQGIEIDPVSGHMTVRSLCVLRHLPSGIEVGEGLAFCSTREKKYAYRGGKLTCPECGEAAVQKGKTRDQSAAQFYCYRKTGGCGATWNEGTEQFDAFEAERKLGQSRLANPDLPDEYNTVVKMGAKRAHIAAMLMATGASDVFTQDVEDMPGKATGESSTRAPVRQNEPRLEIPTSWAALTEAFEKNFVESEWLAQAIEAKFEKPLDELDAATRRNEAFQFARGCYVALFEILGKEGKLEFPGPKRSDLRRVFASRLEGLELDGPPWRIHPLDYDPDEEQYDVRPTDVPDPDVDDIPFGEVDPPGGDDDIPFGEPPGDDAHSG